MLRSCFVLRRREPDGSRQNIIGEVIDDESRNADKIREFQRRLYTKAKQEPSYRFYLLYDKIHREDILAHAYELAKTNGGAAGVDGQSFSRIETQGRESWLAELRQELIQASYQPQAVRRVMIPKPDGSSL